MLDGGSSWDSRQHTAAAFGGRPQAAAGRGRPWLAVAGRGGKWRAVAHCSPVHQAQSEYKKLVC